MTLGEPTYVQNVYKANGGRALTPAEVDAQIAHNIYRVTGDTHDFLQATAPIVPLANNLHALALFLDGEAVSHVQAVTGGAVVDTFTPSVTQKEVRGILRSLARALWSCWWASRKLR